MTLDLLNRLDAERTPLDDNSDIEPQLPPWAVAASEAERRVLHPLVKAFLFAAVIAITLLITAGVVFAATQMGSSGAGAGCGGA